MLSCCEIEELLYDHAPCQVAHFLFREHKDMIHWINGSWYDKMTGVAMDITNYITKALKDISDVLMGRIQGWYEASSCLEDRTYYAQLQTHVHALLTKLTQQTYVNQVAKELKHLFVSI